MNFLSQIPLQAQLGGISRLSPRRVLSVVLSLSLFCCSCVTPPRLDKAQVLPEKELEIIATMKRGKDYAAAGRLDLAEYQYRKVLLAGVRSSSVYNDLGFVLEGMSRFDEAEEMFRNALEIQTRNIVARENLARLLVFREKLAEARQQFERVLDDYNRFTKRELLETIGEDFTVNDLMGIYRNLSMLEFHDGNYDEAACSSQRAFELAGNPVQRGQHVRLLLSLGYTARAHEVLKAAAGASGTATDPKTLLDLGIAIYSIGDFSQASEVIEALINRPDLESHDRQTARLLKLILITRRSAGRAAKNSSRAALPPNPSGDFLGNAEERESFDALAEEFPRLCKTYVVDPDEYWPDTLRDEVKNEITMLCDDDELVYPGTRR